MRTFSSSPPSCGFFFFSRSKPNFINFCIFRLLSFIKMVVDWSVDYWQLLRRARRMVIEPGCEERGVASSQLDNLNQVFFSVQLHTYQRLTRLPHLLKNNSNLPQTITLLSILSQTCLTFFFFFLCLLPSSSSRTDRFCYFVILDLHCFNPLASVHSEHSTTPTDHYFNPKHNQQISHQLHSCPHRTAHPTSPITRQPTYPQPMAAATECGCRAWIFHDDDSTKFALHQGPEPKFVDHEGLAKIGVLYYKMEEKDQDPKLAALREERGYSEFDYVSLNKDIPQAKFDTFFDEHLHEDEVCYWCCCD